MPDRRMNFNQVDFDINRWLPAESKLPSYNTANRTVLRMFFEDLRNTNNPIEALRNTAKRVEPFGFTQSRVMEITRKWREAHGLKNTVVFGTHTRKVGVAKRIIAAAQTYFNVPLESSQDVAEYLESLVNVTSPNPDADAKS